MARYTKAQQIADMIKELNEHRVKVGLIPVKRAWTGLAHWLVTDDREYNSIGGLWKSDDGFIGFISGLIYGHKNK